MPAISGLGCSGESFCFVGSWGGVLFVVLFFFHSYLLYHTNPRKKMGCILKLFMEKLVWKSPGQVNRLIELFQLALRKHYDDRGF